MRASILPKKYLALYVFFVRIGDNSNHNAYCNLNPNADCNPHHYAGFCLMTSCNRGYGE